MTNLNALVLETGEGNFLVLAKFLEKLDLGAIRVQKLSDFPVVMEMEGHISIAIIDMLGFDDGIWDICKEIKRRDIPMLMISSNHTSEIIRACYAAGARGIFKKPVLMKELADSIHSLIA
jgi:DNA-binding NarL/FixJ family response regulator